MHLSLTSWPFTLKILTPLFFLFRFFTLILYILLPNLYFRAYSFQSFGIQGLILNIPFEFPNNKPSEILINGTSIDYKINLNKNTNLYEYNITIDANISKNIIIKWNNPINSTYRMFYKVKDIMNIDLNNFNTSLINNMKEMFSYCGI